MIDHVAVFIHQVAIPVLADADTVDAGSQPRKAHIHRHPAGTASPRHGADHRDHPRVVSFKDGFHMRRTDIALVIPLRHAQVKGKIFKNFPTGLVLQRPAILQCTGGVVGRHCHHFTAGVQPGIEVGVPALRRGVHLLHDVVDRLFQIFHIVADGSHDLAYRLGTAGTGALHHRGTVTLQEGPHAQQQCDRRHRRDQNNDQRRRAGRPVGPLHETAPSPAAWAARWRRSAPGEVPLYFLKQ